MASKRTINRSYWVAVKAFADNPNSSNSHRAWLTFRQALTGHIDRFVLPTVDALESIYGPHRVHADLHNETLWNARMWIDETRRQTLAKDAPIA